MAISKAGSAAKDAEFTPREIEVFASVMLHGTTTKAADALDITQPAVSKMLHQLAEKAGFQLFRKSRQRLKSRRLRNRLPKRRPLKNRRLKSRRQ